MATSRAKILAHFKKVDPVLYSAIRKDTALVLHEDRDPFLGLCTTVISQQLSVKAAASIRARFESLFPQGKVSPQKLARMKQETLRSIGVSNAKARALIELGERVAKKEFVIEDLKHMSDEEAIAKIVSLRGFGPWSADMYLMFHLGYEDIFAPGDLGLIRGIQKLYKLRKKPDLKTLLRISSKWKPYRSYASLVLWDLMDNKPKD